MSGHAEFATDVGPGVITEDHRLGHDIPQVPFREIDEVRRVAYAGNRSAVVGCEPHRFLERRLARSCCVHP